VVIFFDDDLGASSLLADCRCSMVQMDGWRECEVSREDGD
jgi:hypothetical protein